MKIKVNINIVKLGKVWYNVRDAKTLQLREKRRKHQWLKRFLERSM